MAPWKADPRVEIHGPGWSKVVLSGGPAEGWSEHVELMASSVADNGGRSCINASGRLDDDQRTGARRWGWRERLAKIEARPLDDPEAALAAFPTLKAAEAISDYLDNQLRTPGAEDVTALYRESGRVGEAGGCAFMLPTVIYCSDP